jgi:ABC-2 type transport system permease protein
MRLLSLIKKEFLAIRNDPRAIAVIIAPTLMQLLLFSFAATTEVKHAEVAIYDMDTSAASRDLIEQLKGSPYITATPSIHSREELRGLIDRRRVIGALIIPSGFAAKLARGEAQVQTIFDGRRSNTAQVVDGYISQMLLLYQQGLGVTSPVLIESRYLYNPSIEIFWWNVPNLFGSITMLLAIILSALSIAREKELGTFEQILVSPLRPHEILLGKLIPGVLISTLMSTVVLTLAVFCYGVPFLGSFALLYLGVVIFLFAVSGIGLFISSLCKTQQQAILGSVVFLIPSFLMSGFATPAENMPVWLQHLSNLIPLKYYIIFIKGVFLKDISFILALPLLLKMLALGCASFAAALALFKKKVG